MGFKIERKKEEEEEGCKVLAAESFSLKKKC